jgi:hypothetical protein
MKDGYPMIAEVHQEDLCKPTHVIVPQTKKAERMIGMMNKNLLAFPYHMLLNSLSAKSVLAGEKLIAKYSIST